MSIRNTNTTELIVNIHKRVIEDNLKLLEENEKLKKENEELKEERIDKWYECDGLQEERRSLKAENEKLKAHIVQLEKYITVNCFLGQYDSTATRDDVKYALNEAKEVLDCLRPSI